MVGVTLDLDKGSYIFPSHILPTEAAEYVSNSVHSGEHHFLLQTSHRHICTEMDNSLVVRFLKI